MCLILGDNLVWAGFQFASDMDIGAVAANGGGDPPGCEEGALTTLRACTMQAGAGFGC